MSETLKVVTLLGSLRKGSFNGMVARTLPQLAPAGMEISALPSIGDIPLRCGRAAGRRLSAERRSAGRADSPADGVVIVTPEYNYSVPGGLKTQLTGYPACRSSRFPVSRC